MNLLPRPLTFVSFNTPLPRPFLFRFPSLYPLFSIPFFPSSVTFSCLTLSSSFNLLPSFSFPPDLPLFASFPLRLSTPLPPFYDSASISFIFSSFLLLVPLRTPFIGLSSSPLAPFLPLFLRASITLGFSTSIFHVPPFNRDKSFLRLGTAASDNTIQINSDLRLVKTSVRLSLYMYQRGEQA